MRLLDPPTKTAKIKITRRRRKKKKQEKVKKVKKGCEALMQEKRKDGVFDT